MSNVHELKTEHPWFSAVRNGDKTFEVRKDDRKEGSYAVGDLLILREWTGIGYGHAEPIAARVSYVLRGYEHVAEGYVVLGLKVLS